MAFDNLNQVGKSIRKVMDNADYAAKRAFLNKRIERSRDVFDTTVPFEMEFKTESPNDRVSLDLKFQKPPPRKGCNAECFSNHCETFTFTDGGDHLIFLQDYYIPETPRVFRNRDLLTFINYDETDPAAGEIFVQGISANDEITVCYVTGDCSNECSCGQQTDFTVRTPDGLGEMFIVVNLGPGEGEHTTAAIANSPPQYMHVYAGCTYRMDYSCFWGPTTFLLAVGMEQYPSGANSLGSVTMGYPGNETHYFSTYASTGVDFDVTLGFAQTNGTIANSFNGSEAHVVVTYISGPDPRFEGLTTTACTQCRGKNVIDDIPIEISPGIWKTSLPYVLGTLTGTFNDLPAVITESNPNLGTFFWGTNPRMGLDTYTVSYTAQ